jgi:hypothetical protein
LGEGEGCCVSFWEKVEGKRQKLANRRQNTNDRTQKAEGRTLRERSLPFCG